MRIFVPKVKWYKASEIVWPGNYLFGRVDDEPWSWDKIQVELSDNVPYLANESGVRFQQDRNLHTWDEECRFYGPIPDMSQFEVGDIVEFLIPDDAYKGIRGKVKGFEKGHTEVIVSFGRDSTMDRIFHPKDLKKV